MSILSDIGLSGPILLEFLQELALLFALIGIYSLVDVNLERANKQYRSVLFGIVFGVFCIIGMLAPVEIIPGFLIDPRSVIIALAAVFGGPIAGAIAAVFSSVFRVYLGGDGATIGLVLIAVSYSFGVVFHELHKKKIVSHRLRDFLWLGLAIHSVIVFSFFTLPAEQWADAFLMIALPIFVFFVPSTAILGALLGYMKDHQSMVAKLEERDRNLLAALSRLEEQHKVLNEHAIVTETDQAGRITYVNDKFCEISKYSREELLGQNHRILKSGLHPPEFFEEFWKIISSGEIWQGEVCNKAKDGSLYWVASTVMPVYRHGKGVISGYISVRTDITESKRTEDALRHSQKMEAVGELTGGIAHDFNNLLGIIVGNHDLLMRKLEEGSKEERLLQKAQKAALRGATLTRRLLGFSRRDSHEVKVTDLNDIIGDLEELVGRSLTSKNKLTTKLAEGVWPVEIDPSDFEDALINLTVNARDAMPEGGIISIETRNFVPDHTLKGYRSQLQPGEYVEVVVSDTGQGMPLEIREKVFEPFFTTKEQGKGTGLGLSMVYGFVKRSNGHILIYSEEGQGTAFKIYLPRSRKQDEATVDLPTIEIADLTGHEKILVVDDEAELLEYAKETLEDQGYKVITASSGDEAATYLKVDQEIALIFSDIVMPGKMSGFDLAEFSQSLGRDIKVVLASGFTKDMKHSELGRKWQRNLIAKPYRADDMLKRVRMQLDNIHTDTAQGGDQ